MSNDDGSKTRPYPTRRHVATAAAAAIAMPATLAARPANAKAVMLPAIPDDDAFMQAAIDIAKSEGKRDAAVIVANGEIIARGFNPGRDAPGGFNPTNHGDMVAINNCVDTHGADALRGATLYTTGEPCPMCMGAIVWSRIGRVVYAVPIKRIATIRNQIMIPCTEIAREAAFVEIGITGGVLEDEAWKLFA